MSETIKIVIADDEQLIRSGLKLMLNTFSDIEVVGVASNGQEALEQCQQHEVDVVLMDIRMPKVNGIEGTKLIKTHFSNVAVLIVTTFQDSDYILKAMNEGASGYLLKDSDYDDIYQAIKTVAAKQIVLDAAVTKQLLQQSSPVKSEAAASLSQKEIQLLSAIAHGLNNKEIAQQLFLAEGTVKNNISQLLVKLDLRDRTQLAIFAIENGLKE
ncbi:MULTISPECIES: response regulator transcription factor [unclassified Facklamia]|uniref:response regulator transcription factor n=1 Tax=Aerococcaceae TaxID=186827 RepID=UPI0013BAF3FF|nr:MULTISPECIES: response regulator transcription factor [unclassified Facklamia]NEW64449.1 response regulator [Facklamia sp. 252]NEW67656.1 response regulator [Facklamia sp. 253]QQD65636.1 response regulator transcription factor [Aerococcaceae bacterium zg-252]